VIALPGDSCRCSGELSFTQRGFQASDAAVAAQCSRIAAADIVYVEKTSGRRTGERYRISPQPMARCVHRNDRGELCNGASAGNNALLGAGCAALAVAGLRRRRGLYVRVQTSCGPTSPGEARRGTHGIATATRRQRASTTGRTAEHRHLIEIVRLGRPHYLVRIVLPQFFCTSHSWISSTFL